MKESDNENSSPMPALQEGLEKDNSPEADTQTELLRMINHSLKLESLAKDHEISEQAKEIIRLKREIVFLKRNFSKFCKLLFQLLRKTQIDGELYKALCEHKAEIFTENTLFFEKEEDFTASDEKKGVLDETIPASDGKIPVSGETARDSDGIAGDSYGTMSDSYGKTRDSYETARSSHEKTGDSHGKIGGYHEKTGASDGTTGDSSGKARASDETAGALDGTSRDSYGKTSALDGLTGDSHGTMGNSDETIRALNGRSNAFDERAKTFGGNPPGSDRKASSSSMPGNILEVKPEAKVPTVRVIDLNTIMHDMINRNTKHRSMYIDGEKRLIANKNEKHVSELVYQALFKFTKLPGYNDQQNLNIAYRLTRKLSREFSGRRFEVMTFVTLSKMLIYIYCKRKFTQHSLCNDLNYSRTHFYRMKDLLKEKQWIEAYNLKQSDAFYISEKGKQYVESVLKEV